MLNSQPHIRINLQEKTLGLDKCWNSFDLSKWCQHKHRDHTHLYHSKLFYTFIMQVTEPNDDYYNEFFLTICMRAKMSCFLYVHTTSM